MKNTAFHKKHMVSLVLALAAAYSPFATSMANAAASNFFAIDQLYSFQSQNYPNHYIGVTNDLGFIKAVSDNSSYEIKNSATFIMRPGLADPINCVSFEHPSGNGYFLRHQDYRIKFHSYQNTDLFKKDATFCPRNALTGIPGNVTFESYNYPNHFIRHANYELSIAYTSDSQLFKMDASFKPVQPWVSFQIN